MKDPEHTLALMKEHAHQVANSCAGGGTVSKAQRDREYKAAAALFIYVTGQGLDRDVFDEVLWDA